MEPWSSLSPFTDLVEAPLTGPFFIPFGTPPVQEMFKKMLEAAGVQVELRGVDKIGPLLKAGKWGGLVLNASFGERDAPPGRYWNLPLVAGRYDQTARTDAFDDDTYLSTVHIVPRSSAATFVRLCAIPCSALVSILKESS